MSWCLTLSSGPDSCRLHLGEDCTQTNTGAIISAGHYFTPGVVKVWIEAPQNYMHFIQDLTSLSPENIFVSFWSPPQHQEIFKETSRHKRPCELMLYIMQWAQIDPCSDFFFFSSSHSHLSPIVENRNPCVAYLLLILSSRKEKKKLKPKKNASGCLT